MNTALLPLLLQGVIQHYAWGGYDFIAELSGQTNSENTPWAELWLGAHPKGPAVTESGPLNELIAAAPAEVLSPDIAQKYDDQLPFLLKVLDVDRMLSIQIHPTKTAAAAGFAAEEAAGINRMAPHRNYRDTNHKPELGVALTDFYLLHGFKSESQIRAIILAEPAWSELLPILDEGGLEPLYQRVMSADQQEVNQWLEPVVKRLSKLTDLQKDSSDYWAQQAIATYGEKGNYDRGIFSIYWLNLVRLQAGQGIFQAAGIPHAYLSGCCIELMANSDNVLRGGLTPKHIDVPELMRHISFDAVNPVKLIPKHVAGDWSHYAVPVEDFMLYVTEISAGDQCELPAGPAILLLLEGQGHIGDLSLNQGAACWLPYGHGQKFQARAASRIYVAGVGR